MPKRMASVISSSDGFCVASNAGGRPVISSLLTRVRCWQHKGTFTSEGLCMLRRSACFSGALANAWRHGRDVIICHVSTGMSSSWRQWPPPFAATALSSGFGPFLLATFLAAAAFCSRIEHCDWTWMHECHQDSQLLCHIGGVQSHKDLVCIM